MSWEHGPRGRLFYRSREHQAAQFALVVAALGDITGLSVLDVGCGYGDFSALLPPDQPYLGIDADEDVIRTARETYEGREFECSTLIRPADVILLIGSLQCEVVGPEQLLRDVRRNARRVAVVATTTHWHHPPEEVHSWWPQTTLGPVEDDFYTLTWRKHGRSRT